MLAEGLPTLGGDPLPSNPNDLGDPTAVRQVAAKPVLPCAAQHIRDSALGPNVS